MSDVNLSDSGSHKTKEAPMERTIDVTLTARELQVLTCAMAGNFPPKLNDTRMPTLRKLARASHALKDADGDEH